MPDARAWTPRPIIRASIWLHAASVPAAALLPLAAWPWIAAALLANHAVLAVLCLCPRSQAIGPTLRGLPPEEARQGLVALTFDDGPDPAVTPRVLDALDAAGAKASFFCVGMQAELHPALIAEIAARGHAVENHSWSHRYGFALCGVGTMTREMRRTQAVLHRLAGQAPRWFRAPAGIRSPLLDAALAQCGLFHASWSRRGFDTSCREPARVLRRLTRGLRGGEVLLLHDSGRGRTRSGDPMVLAVLPHLLQAITAAGLRAVALPQPPALAARTAAAASADGAAAPASAARASL